MNWLLFVAGAIMTDAPRIFVDNYVSDVFFRDRYAASQKLFYGYTYSILGIILIAIFANDFSQFSWLAIALLFISGVISSIANVPYYMALEIDDSTNLGIFLQLAPIFYLLFGFLFYGETITIQQLFALLVILAGPVIIVFASHKRARHLRIRAILLTLIYVVMSVIGNLIFVENQVEGVGFFAPIAIFFLGKGIANLLIVYSNRKWLAHYRKVVKRNKFKVYFPMLINHLFGTTTDFVYRVALTLAPSAAVASAIIDSSTPIVIFFMGIIATIIAPKFGREKLNRRTVLAHLFATILVVIGVIMIQ